MVSFVEQACISGISHIIKLHLLHNPRSRAKRLSPVLSTELFPLLSSPFEDLFDTLLSVRLESQVDGL